MLSVYFTGGQKKNLENLRYTVLQSERIVWPKRSFDGMGRILLYRNPYAIWSSRHKFARRWHRDDWKLTADNLDLYMQQELKPLMKMSLEAGTIPVSFDGFMDNPEEQLRGVCGVLDVAFEPTMLSFFETFERYGCACGGHFSIRKAKGFSSAYLEKRTDFSRTEQEEDRFVCDQCGAVTVGFGLFNPCSPFSQNRTLEWTHMLSAEERALIAKSMKKYLGAEILNYFEQNTDWSKDSFVLEIQRLARTLG
ncbi:MAG: hypothetical protein HQM00_04810 [Magnetococcales bacterium]|nr:hypothetical protein [Magnetococcales bacterium]